MKKSIIRAILVIIVIAVTLSILHYEVDYFTPDPVLQSDNLTDYTFKLDKKIYTLPFAFADLLSDGWEISTEGYEEAVNFHGHQRRLVDLKKKDKHISVVLNNPSGDRIVHTEADVAGVSIYFDSKVKVELPKKVTEKFTPEALITAYGDPETNRIYDQLTHITYSKEPHGYDRATFRYFDKPEKTQPIIELLNIKYIHSFPRDREPDEVKAYIPPAELGDDISSGRFELYGHIYQFPAPVKEFLDNGWQLSHYPSGIFSGCAQSIEIHHSTKDTQSIYLYIYNPATYMTTVENCMAYGMQTSGPIDYSLSLPEGISASTTQKEIDALTQEGSWKQHKDPYPSLSYYYTNSKIDIGISFFDKNKPCGFIKFSLNDDSYMKNYLHTY